MTFRPFFPRVACLALPLALAVAGSGSVRGADAAPAQAAATSSDNPLASPPAGTLTIPSPQPAVDRTTPDKTWAAMLEAIKAGDLAAFRACCYSRNEISKLFMDAYSDSVLTTFRLAAAVNQLGDDGKALGKNLESTYNDLTTLGKNRKVEVDGDTAVWIQTDTGDKTAIQRVMYFHRVNNEWLLDTEHSYSLDTADGRKVAEDFMAASSVQLRMLRSVIADIQSKKITTVDQMRQQLTNKS